MVARIVAIDGPGGAGKSSLADALAARLDRAPVLHTDDFASWDNPLDWAPRLVEEALEPLSRRRSVRFRRTDWEGKGRVLWRNVQAADFVVLEGMSAGRPAFRPFLTYSIWVETPRELRLRRGLERDGADALPQWERWMAEEDRHVEQERPQEHADLVVPGDRDLWS